MDRIASIGLVLLMIVSFPTSLDASSGEGGVLQAREEEALTFISLGGSELVSDAASVRFVGETLAGAGGDMGTFSFVGDINTDGIPDLALAAPGMPGLSGQAEDGRIYVFFGDGDRPGPVMDMDEAEPDLIIYGDAPTGGNKLALSMATAMLAEDFDGDGLNDLAVCCPSNEKNPILAIIYCPVAGWPEWISITMDDNSYLNASLNELIHSDQFVDSSEGPMISTISKCIGGFNRGSDSQYSPFMRAADIDGDGYTDLVGSGCYTPTYRKNGIIYFHYYGNVRIIWGGPIADMELTILTKLEYDRYGFSMDIGDIDGDGSYDMVVGTSFANDEPKIQCGNVSVYFNISSLRGVGIQHYENASSTVITGSDRDDELGTAVLLRDLDGDGKDEIIASSPNNDGPDDATADCGGLFIYRGRPEQGFPSRMDAESDLDMLVMGDDDPINRQGIAFHLGRSFEVEDVTGDGKADLIVSTSGADLPSIGADPRFKAGSVLFYDHDKVFRSTIVRLDSPSGLFNVEGMDIEDGLGFYMGTGDLDGDGLKDVFMGAPSADGMGNDRPRCGEMFLMYSSFVRLGDLSITGEGWDDGTIFASGGRVRLEVPLTNERPLVPVTGYMIDIGGLRLTVTDTVEVSDPYGRLKDATGGLAIVDGKGKIWLETELTWSFPAQENDVVVTAIDADGRQVVRTYRDAFSVARDLSFGEGSKILVNGMERFSQGAWTGPGDRVTIGGIPILYAGTDREMQAGQAVVVVSRGGSHQEMAYTSLWSYEDIIDTMPSQEYTLDILLADPPQGTPPPDLEKGYRVRFLVDGQAPDVPEIALYQEGTREGIGKKGEWVLECGGGFGPDFDSGGSGVKEYVVLDGDADMPMIEQGSLLATYYMDGNMEEEALIVPEDGIDHEWGMWGPYPDLHKLPPTGFSVRWHGRIRVQDTGPYRFELRGRGEGMMVLDGEVAIDLDDLSFGPRSAVLPLSSDDLHEVVLYYFHSDVEESPSFRFWWLDTNNSLEAVPPGVLYRPTNITTVRIEDSEDTIQRIAAIDWVGRRSGSATITADLDMEAPAIDARSIPPWTNGSRPAFRVGISDGGSGLDVPTLRYRLLEEGQSFGTWITRDIGMTDIVKSGNRTISLTAVLPIALDPGFLGRLYIEMNDVAGNVGTSGPVPIGLDVDAPSIDLVEPDGAAPVNEGRNTFTLRVRDRGGSGADLSTLEFRYRSGGDWQEWTSLSRDGRSEEATVQHTLDLVMGEFSVQYRVMDMAGNLGASALHEFTVNRPPVDLPPIPVISLPANGSRFLEGAAIELSGAGTSDDGLGLYDPVRMTWSSNISGYLGSGIRITAKLQAGTHRITLFADDGTPGHNVSASIEVVVTQPVEDDIDDDGKERDPGNLALAIQVLVLLLVLGSGMIVLFLLFRRNRSSGQTLMGIPPEE